MSDFSVSWLALREPVDHRSRDRALAARLAAVFAGRERLFITDLGSGTASNLRALAPLLPAEQHWTLLDNDPALLEEAARALTRWADSATPRRRGLHMRKAGKELLVTFSQCNLSEAVEAALSPPCGLVTASALFDLTSAAWIERLMRGLAGSGAIFYTTLTYDGRDTFAPAHPLDAALATAFVTHMQRDKGFGPACGAMATKTLTASLRQAGYAVASGSSPWVLREEDAALAQALCRGMAEAVRETGLLPAPAIEAWLAFRCVAAAGPGARLEVGHSDLLAWPEEKIAGGGDPR